MKGLHTAGIAFGLALFVVSAVAADPAARFVTGPSAQEVKVTIDGPVFAHELIIQADQESKGLTVKSTDLGGPGPVKVTCQVDGADCSKAFDLQARAARTVKLSGTVDQPGIYSGVVMLLGVDPPQRIQLQVTRNAAAFPVELAASVSAASTRRGAVTLSIPLQEKHDRVAMLNTPSLALARREAGKSALESVTVVASMKIGEATVSAPWKIERRAAPTLLVHVTQLDDSGEYIGRLRLTSTDSLQVLDIPVLITKKDAWSFAAFLIGLGAVVSLGLRTYLKHMRPRLQQQQAAAQLASDLDRLQKELSQRFAPLSAEELAVLSALADRLASPETAIAAGRTAEAQPVLDEIDTKLSLVRRWINARRKAGALLSIPDDVRTTLSELATFLSRPAAVDATAATRLDNIETKISAEAVKQTNERRLALELGLEASRYLDSLARDALLKELAGAARLDYADQHAALDRIEQALVDRQLSGLRRAVEAAAVPPVGFDPASWNALATDVLNDIAVAVAAPPHERRVRYRGAVAKYLAGLLTRLRAWAATWEGAIQRSATHTDDQKRPLLERLPPVRQALDAADKLLQDGKLNDAAAVTEEIGSKSAGLEAELKQGGFLSAGAAPAATASVPQVLDLQGSLASALMAGLGLRSLRRDGSDKRRLTHLIDQFDLLVLLVALAISILLGLKLLWLDNATWGSDNDYIVAFLWGLGLHQVANAAFEGVAGTAEKFAK